MDKKLATMIGVGICACSKLMQDKDHKLTRAASYNENNANEAMGPGPVISISPAGGGSPVNINNVPLDEFESERYRISFKYPRGWRRNPRYEDKYEGKTGFFEVTDFESNQDNIDAATKQEISEPYSPFGSNPTVINVTVEGQPARIIYPSSDQSSYFKDRDAALIVQYPTPIKIDDKYYPFVIIWATREYIPLIASTLRFVR